MGNGPMSMANCYLLHKKLDTALETLSGIQQGGDDDGSVERLATDIYIALIGSAFDDGKS